MTTDDHPEPEPAPAPGGAHGTGDAAGVRRWRLVTARVLTTVAALLVLFALIAPNQLTQLTPGAFLRIPLEGLLAIALVLVLPARARWIAASLLGVAFGLLAVAKVMDMGFFAVRAQPFDPVLDWGFLAATVDYLAESIGRTGATWAVVGAMALAAAVLVLMTLSVLRLSALVVRHRRTTVRAAAVFGVAWLACALLGVQIVPGVPVAANEYGRVLELRTSLRDQDVFADELAVDAFHDTPGTDLLTALAGTDVVLVFVESYGRDAVEDPQLASRIGAVLDDGDRRLAGAGFASRSGFLTSPTVGGGSWLAHATLLSGVWIDNQQRYDTFLDSDRLTLTGAFQRAGWRTVGVMPGVIEDWPEAPSFGYDRIHDQFAMEYEGPRTNWGKMPDQYTFSFFERRERSTSDRDPVMAEIGLVSSHAPWMSPPEVVDWEEVGDGTVFEGMADTSSDPASVLRDPDTARAAYRQVIEYSLEVIISYVETYGDDDLVLVVLGDHQPAASVTGPDPDRDVPISIIARDRTVLDRLTPWNWQAGLHPDPRAPVWPMDEFRDRFLNAYGPPA